MKRSPFDEIEQLFDRTLTERTWGSHGVDVADYDDEFVVMADLPGFDPDAIEARARDGSLRIRAERTTDADDREHRYVRRERRSESVSRTIDLPVAVVEEEASASYRNGVLTVRLPKERLDEDDGHRIDIE